MEKIDNLEIKKAEISTYINRLNLRKKLKEKRNNLFYKLGGVKAIRYDIEKGNGNPSGIEERKLEILEEITKIDIKIKENNDEIRRIEIDLKEIDKRNEIYFAGGKKTFPSLIIIIVLCKLRTYKETCDEFGFKSTSSLSNFINKNIEKIIEE